VKERNKAVFVFKNVHVEVRGATYLLLKEPHNSLLSERLGMSFLALNQDLPDFILTKLFFIEVREQVNEVFNISLVSLSSTLNIIKLRNLIFP
jgi:hypothetical protein